jgi:hypothetical protein
MPSKYVLIPELIPRQQLAIICNTIRPQEVPDASIELYMLFNCAINDTIIPKHPKNPNTKEIILKL